MSFLQLLTIRRSIQAAYRGYVVRKTLGHNRELDRDKSEHKKKLQREVERVRIAFVKIDTAEQRGLQIKSNMEQYLLTRKYRDVSLPF